MERIVIPKDFQSLRIISIVLASVISEDWTPLESLLIHERLLKKASLRELVAKLCKEYDIVEVLGHRDTSSDLDGSGEVEPAEYIKACPCFDVRSEFSNFLRNTVILP